MKPFRFIHAADLHLDTPFHGIGREPGVTVFGSTSVQSVAVVRAGITLATVHGISYAKRDTTENLALGFNRTPGRRAPHRSAALPRSPDASQAADTQASLLQASRE
jgi:hypothetical protein